MPSLLLHPEYLLRIPFKGKQIVAAMERLAQTAKAEALSIPSDPNWGITVLIRTRNDEDNIGSLLEDIRANKEYFAGPVQVVLVDTESTDDTLWIARKYEKHFDLTVLSIKQSEFNYAKSLNTGFRVAKHDFVYTLVGHSSIAAKVALMAARRYANRPEVAGMFCWPMPSASASKTELFGSIMPAMTKQISPAHEFPKPSMGIMGANCSMVRRSVWEKLGGYDERFGAGGEDGDFGIRALAAGYKVLVEPVIVAHHSHGVGPIAAIRQFLYWHKIAKPYDFDAKRLTRFRKDLRTKLQG